MLGPRHAGYVLERVAAIFDRRRRFVEFALEVKLRFVEACQQQLQSFFEQRTVLFGVDQRRAEALQLACVVAAADAHDDPPVSNDVGHCVILRKADRVPHRQHIESAAELQPPGLRREPQPKLHQVGKDLVALALEMVLRHPQHVEAGVIHHLGDVARCEECLAQLFVGIAAVIRGCAVESDVVELDLADIEHVEVLDHAFRSRCTLRWRAAAA